MTGGYGLNCNPLTRLKRLGCIIDIGEFDLMTLMICFTVYMCQLHESEFFEPPGLSSGCRDSIVRALRA